MVQNVPKEQKVSKPNLMCELSRAIAPYVGGAYVQIYGVFENLGNRMDQLGMKSLF